MLNCPNNMKCSDTRSPVISERSEPTSGELKAGSDILFCFRSRTSGSSLVFLTLTLARAILLHAATSRKQL